MSSSCRTFQGKWVVPVAPAPRRVGGGLVDKRMVSPAPRGGVITIVPDFSLILHDFVEAHARGGLGTGKLEGDEENDGGRHVATKDADDTCGGGRAAHRGGRRLRDGRAGPLAVPILHALGGTRRRVRAVPVRRGARGQGGGRRGPGVPLRPGPVAPRVGRHARPDPRGRRHRGPPVPGGPHPDRPGRGRRTPRRRLGDPAARAARARARGHRPRRRRSSTRSAAFWACSTPRTRSRHSRRSCSARSPSGCSPARRGRGSGRSPSAGAPAQRVARAIRWLRDHFAEPLRVEDAREARGDEPVGAPPPLQERDGPEPAPVPEAAPAPGGAAADGRRRGWTPARRRSGSGTRARPSSAGSTGGCSATRPAGTWPRSRSKLSRRRNPGFTFSRYSADYVFHSVRDPVVGRRAVAPLGPGRVTPRCGCDRNGISCGVFGKHECRPKSILLVAQVV